MEIIPHYRYSDLFTERSSYVWWWSIHNSMEGCPIYWTGFYSLFILKIKKKIKKNSFIENGEMEIIPHYRYLYLFSNILIMYSLSLSLIASIVLSKFLLYLFSNSPRDIY